MKILTIIAGALMALSLLLLIVAPLIDGERLPEAAVVNAVYLMIAAFGVCLLINLLIAIDWLRMVLFSPRQSPDR